jgi:NADH:ubiquinone oxidoreductase subunit D
MVRVAEIRESVSLIKQAIPMPSGPLAAPLGHCRL